MSFKNTSTQEFTEALASKTSVPGGGGASALVGSIGIALGDMVGEFTVGKKKYADVEEDIKIAMEKAQTLRVKLLDLMDRDAVVFEPLSKAYGIPKDDPTRGEVLEACLHDAAEVPMEILRLCCEAIDVLSEFAEKGSRIVISDAAVSAAALRGALLGAAVNVKINTKLMTDRAHAEVLNEEIEKRLSDYTAKADAIYRGVYESL